MQKSGYKKRYEEFSREGEHSRKRDYEQSSPCSTDQTNMAAKRKKRGDVKSSCKCCEQNKYEHKRPAAEVVLSGQEQDTERINNPVSKTRLTEMYQKLKLLQWPKIKDLLKANDVTSEFTRDLIQKIFKDSTAEMERKTKQIDEVLGLIELNSGINPQKVKDYRQLAIQNLQLSLYHNSKEDLLKTPLFKHEAHYSQDVMVKLRLLATECYWLGCLMALNNPPLVLDWQNHIPGMDHWDIFPGGIRSPSVM
ncbi:unnamed protein product [Oreochromis niloticus]|nr:unnamed protein product [Mustela putorius furo]